MPKKLILPNEDFSILELSTSEYDRYVVEHKITGLKAYGVSEEDCFSDLLAELSEFYNKKVVREPK